MASAKGSDDRQAVVQVHWEDFKRMQEQCDSGHAKIESLLHQLDIQSKRIEKFSEEYKNTKDQLIRLKENFGMNIWFGDISSPSDQEQRVYVFPGMRKFHKTGDCRCHEVSCIKESSENVALASVALKFGREPCKICFPTEFGWSQFLEVD